MWCKMGREKKKLTVNGGVIRAWSVGRCGENGTRDFGGWSWMEFADCSRSSTRYAPNNTKHKAARYGCVALLCAMLYASATMILDSFTNLLSTVTAQYSRSLWASWC